MILDSGYKSNRTGRARNRLVAQVCENISMKVVGYDILRGCNCLRLAMLSQKIDEEGRKGKDRTAWLRCRKARKATNTRKVHVAVAIKSEDR